MDFNDDNKNENSSTTPDFTDSAKENFNRSADKYAYRYRNNNNNVEMKRGRKKVLKSIISTVAAGVVGSALTLTALPYTGYMKNGISNSQPVTAVSPDSSVSYKSNVANV